MVKPDLTEAFYSACALLEKSFFVDARYCDYAGLKATASLENGTVRARVSRGFENAPREVLLGLALYLLSKMFCCRVDARLVKPYKEFSRGKSAAELSKALRRARGRSRRNSAKGKNYDLEVMLDELWPAWEGIEKPSVEWSRRKSRRKLGWFDDAFNKIVLNRALDERAPRFVVEYVLFHELLHAKHDVIYGRGKSLRRAVHTQGFRRDEEGFVHAREAEEWLRCNW